MPVRHGIKSWHLSLLPSSITNSAPHQHGLPSTFRRHLYNFNIDQGTLQPCTPQKCFRPVFQAYTGMHRNRISQFVDHSTLERLRQEQDDWMKVSAPRLKSAGLYVNHERWADFPYRDGRIQKPNAAIWQSATILRYGCKTALIDCISDLEEINARKLCVELKDPRYPTIFHSLETQAHLLYVIGRVELERSSKTWQHLGYFILCVSAGLGQLDAALLLHQLEKCNRAYAVQVVQRAVITRAAESRLDWRAMLAHSEYIISKAEGRSGSKRLQPAELEQCLDLLLDAMEITDRPTAEAAERMAPPEGCLDADSMMVFNPPYRLLFDVTLEEITLGNTSDRVLEAFEAAASLGVHNYEDTTVAGRYAQYLLQTRDEYTDEWLYCTKMAANSGDVDACFQLAKYYFEKDGWSPSLAARILEDRTNQLRQQQASLGNQNIEELIERPGFNEDIHQEVLNKRDMNLLKGQEGVRWMKLAAQIPVDNAAQILNRYVIIAGLLRLNGFSEEGRELLLEARAQLQDCVDKPSTKARALRTLNEYLEFWNQKLIHQLLYPGVIDQLLKH